METETFTFSLTALLTATTIGSTAIASYAYTQYRLLREQTNRLEFMREIDGVYKYTGETTDEIRADIRDQFGDLRRELAEEMSMVERQIDNLRDDVYSGDEELRQEIIALNKPSIGDVINSLQVHHSHMDDNNNDASV
jgi:hypothetical protein